jgi:Pyruvate/2-oxoacid:ferredoxin oxidoreductase delta subunit
MKKSRAVIRIDESKCNGCGLCISSCAERALQIVDGKARLVSETYCDGLGACLKECPQGALTIENRTAEAFDEAAVHRHLTGQASAQPPRQPVDTPESRHQDKPTPHVCPGSFSTVLRRESVLDHQTDSKGAGSERPLLSNWPVQLRLAPVKAPYFDGARLLIAADCTPFAFAGFHRHFLAGRTVLVGCPKLDDVELYRDKLTQIFQQNDIADIEVVHMEVPCCFGLVHLLRQALEESGKDIPLTLTKIGIRGTICETSKEPARVASR